MTAETNTGQGTPGAEAQQVAERSLLGLLASDANTVAVAAAATAASTAAGIMVKNAMDRHGPSGDGTGSSGGDGGEPGATAS